MCLSRDNDFGKNVNFWQFYPPVLIKIYHEVLKRKLKIFASNDSQTDDDERKLSAISYLSDLGDLKMKRKIKYSHCTLIHFNYKNLFLDTFVDILQFF